MAIVTCAISNITYKVPHVPMLLDNTFIAHPIFYAPSDVLEKLYIRYNQGQLRETDSYLLFLALIHSTDCVEWEHPCTDSPKEARTIQIIASSIEELTRVIWMTGEICHPAFKQPRYIFRKEGHTLKNIKHWIAAWRENISNFRLGIAIQEEIDALTVVENRLAILVRSGTQDITLASCVAEWASKAACFPRNKEEEYKSVIRKCFTPAKIFTVDTAVIKEIKHFCEDNIESTSIHFHTLMETLRAGYKNNLNYLGIVDAENFKEEKPQEYRIFSQKEEGILEKEAETLKDTISKAPENEPIESEYRNKLEYMRARLKYMTAKAYKS